jgi:hypothetical protein
VVTWAVPRIVAKNLLLIGCIHAPSKGYEGERAALTTPIKHGATGRLTDDQRTVNLLHAATRARPLAAQDHLQGAAPGQPMPLAHRRHH